MFGSILWSGFLTFILLLLGVYVSSHLIIMKLARDHLKQAEEEKEEEKERQKKKEKQMKYKNSLFKCCERAITSFEAIPPHLRSAESYLDQAEIDFKQRAYIPFWNSIEKALVELGEVNKNLGNIYTESVLYRVVKERYEGKPPTFPLTERAIQKTNVSQVTMEKLNKMVRAAHQDDKFASIYLQLRTNKILIAGFTNLAEALDNMSMEITNSIDQLNESANSFNQTLEQMHSKTLKRSEETAQREEKAIKMLDNIQRGDKPLW